MKTVSGQTVLLDPKKLGPDPEKAIKYMVWGCSMFAILFIMLPLFLLARQFEIANAGIILGIASFCVSIVMTGYMKRLVSAADPTIQHKGARLVGHFRLYFASSILFFLCAGLTPVLIGGVLLFWMYAEFHHFSTIQRVTDDALCAAYPVRFSELENGDLLYDSRAKIEGVITEPWYYSKTAEAFLIPVVSIIGGFLYIRSFTLRDNFEPRLLILGCIVLFVAFVGRSSITHVALDIRAVKLKAEGKF